MLTRRQQMRWLHSSGRVMQVGRVQDLVVKRVRGVAARRGVQRLGMGRRLLELKIVGWTDTTESGDRFWKELRWRGAGFSLAWLLNFLLRFCPRSIRPPAWRNPARQPQVTPVSRWNWLGKL